MLTRFSTEVFNVASLSVVSDAFERIRNLTSAPLSEHDRMAVRDLADALHRRLAALAAGARTGEAPATATAAKSAASAAGTAAATAATATATATPATVTATAATATATKVAAAGDARRAAVLREDARLDYL